MRKRVLKQTIAISALLITSATTEATTASSDLTHYFNSLGFAANVTGSHTYESQAAGFASLGSVYARNQVRTIQIPHLDLPSLPPDGSLLEGDQLGKKKADVPEHRHHELITPIEGDLP